MNLNELISFKGRMRRKHYLIVYGAAFALMIVIGFLQRTIDTSLSLLTYFIAAALIPSSVRRLQDIGYSGWLVIGVIIIPFLSPVLLFAPGEPGSNVYGDNPKRIVPNG